VAPAEGRTFKFPGNDAGMVMGQFQAYGLFYSDFLKHIPSTQPIFELAPSSPTGDAPGRPGLPLILSLPLDKEKPGGGDQEEEK